MIDAPPFIAPEIVEKISEAADLVRTVEEFHQLKKSGSAFTTGCPICNSKDKLTITPSKDIFKCFKCGEGGKGAIAFLTKMEGKTFTEACVFLADRNGIEITASSTNGQPKPKRKKDKSSFRDQQLRESGISEEAQRYTIDLGGGTTKEMDRYVAGTMNRFGDIDYSGDDLILVYLGLDGKPIQYKTPKGAKKEFYRVRYANPSLHLDKNGEPIRYRSPYKSGNHLWIPQYIINATGKAIPFNTLYIIEGEKKADKLCMHDIPAVGIAGIHNFAWDKEDGMPHQLEQIIKECQVQNVVFLLDSDFQDLSIRKGKPVDLRPRTFSKAVIKFKTYFEAYKNEGIHLRIFFGHHLSDDHKGVDDLVVNELEGKEEDLRKDFDKARIDREGKGDFVRLYNITTLSDFQIQEIWSLHSPKAFFKKHKDALQKLEEFRFNKFSWRFSSESGEFEMAQKLMPYEEFWREGEEKNGHKTYYYSYRGLNQFLYNRGYGLLEMDGDNYRFVRLEGKVVQETSHRKIRKFIKDFVKELELPMLEEKILNNGNQFFRIDHAENLPERSPDFLDPEKETHYMIFENHFWRITAENIEQRPIAELPAYIWSNKIVRFNAELLDQPVMNAVLKEGSWYVDQTSPYFEKSDIAQFIYHTSMFSWRKLQDYDEQEGTFINRGRPVAFTDEELEKIHGAVVAKMLAIGYILHEYRDKSNMRAIICMDSAETEVGQSHGGTGKSIFATMFEHLVPAVVIDAKSPRLTEDPHIYEGVDERTNVVVFDDCRVNIDFEFFFSQITRGLTVNPKGQKRFTIEPPKFIFSTNHAMRYMGQSGSRRQYNLLFSDYYNEHRTPYDQFGHQLFDEWEWNDWNYFYNLFAYCIQLYLKHGLISTMPDDDARRRQLRQDMGESFLEWAELHFHPGEESKYRNNRINLKSAFEHLCIEYPKEKKYSDRRKFKIKLQRYAEYSGLQFNPPDGERIRSNGKEYFILADKDYIAVMATTIDNFFANE